MTTAFAVSQPKPLASGQTEIVPQMRVSATEAPARNVELNEGVSVEEVVTRLRSSPRFYPRLRNWPHLLPLLAAQTLPANLRPP